MAIFNSYVKLPEANSTWNIVKFLWLVEIPIIHWSNPMGFAVNISILRCSTCPFRSPLVKSPKNGSFIDLFRKNLERWSDGIGHSPVNHHFFWVNQWGKWPGSWVNPLKSLKPPWLGDPGWGPGYTFQTLMWTGHCTSLTQLLVVPAVSMVLMSFLGGHGDRWSSYMVKT